MSLVGVFECRRHVYGRDKVQENQAVDAITKMPLGGELVGSHKRRQYD